MGPSLSQWIELCDRAEVDDEIVGGMWGSGGITPPPVAHPPITRLALDRARQLIDQAAALPNGAPESGRLRREALEWLAHPHPRASRRVRHEMQELEGELRTSMGGSGSTGR